MVGAVGWKSSSATSSGNRVGIGGQGAVLEVQLSYLFLYFANCGLVVGAVGWKSDSATNLCLVFGLVVEVLLFGSPAQLPVSVY